MTLFTIISKGLPLSAFKATKINTCKTKKAISLWEEKKKWLAKDELLKAWDSIKRNYVNSENLGSFDLIISLSS